jgi:hypothetical protein
MAHAPSQARALLQEAKRGTRPVLMLVKEARSIPDASHAAEALFALSEFVPEGSAGTLLDEVADRTMGIERGWRKAEVVAALAKAGPTWRNGDTDLDAALARFQSRLVKIALTLEDKDLSTALPNVARWCPEAQLPELLTHALEAGSDPLEDGKQVLGLGPAKGLIDAARAWPDAALRARLLAYHHNHNPEPLLEEALAIAATLPDPKQAVEVVRGIVASLAGEDLATVHAALPLEAEPRARLLSALAARADKVGLPGEAASWFQEGEQVAASIPDQKARDAVRANLAKGAERLGGRPATSTTTTTPAPSPAPSSAAARAPKPMPTPATPANRPILALVDTYDGKLGETHLRAIGRAAPLCWAFGLDLALVGFPGGLDQAVRKAGQETNIGEGKGYLEGLAAAHRIHWLPVKEGALPAWPGLPVATTPSPDPARSVDFAGAARAAAGRRLVVLMGLGKRGLPPSWLKAIPHHVELTGSRVSLETATAMGVLAERMRSLGAS